jgi:hypothetical protein
MPKQTMGDPRLIGMNQHNRIAVGPPLMEEIAQ